jgi:L-gulonolactone oxidase
MLATFVLLLLSAAPTLAVPPHPPVRCGDDGCVLSNAYGAWSSDRADCPVSAVTYPASEREVVAAVARASAGGTRVKVVSGFAHTIPKLACPGGVGNGTTLLISTARLDGVEVDAAAGTVTADAGAPLRDVIDAVEARGLSLVGGGHAVLGGRQRRRARRHGVPRQLVVGPRRCRPRPCGGAPAYRARQRG